MPRAKAIPSYTLHKPTGKARVRIGGQDHYLGVYGSPESRQAYARLIAEHFRPGGGDSPAPAEPGGRYPSISVNELFVRYLEHAEKYYVKDGVPTKEVKNMKDAMKAARTLYGLRQALAFGPLALKTVRQFMIGQGDLCRNVINKRIGRLRLIFRWAVGEELVPPSVYEGLRAVEGLRSGRCEAYETEPVGPVADVCIEATLPFLSPQVADMVRLQRLTSMRPGNVVIMRWFDIDQTGTIWLYRPSSHKTKHLGKKLVIPIGPRGREILRQYKDRPPQAFIFSPKEALTWTRERRRQHRHRKTPIYPCEILRLERERKARARRTRQRLPGERYTTSSYAGAITQAVKKANKAGIEIPHWHPNQLRHTRATEVRRQFGLEGAQVVLGHTRADVTQIYAERDLEKAVKIARMTG